MTTDHNPPAPATRAARRRQAVADTVRRLATLAHESRRWARLADVEREIGPISKRRLAHPCPSRQALLRPLTRSRRPRVGGPSEGVAGGGSELEGKLPADQPVLQKALPIRYEFPSDPITYGCSPIPQTS